MTEHRAALPHLASRVLGTPLAITEGKLHVLLHVLGPRIGLGSVPPPAGFEILADPRVELAGPRQGGISGARTVNGVAIIPIMGTIVQRAPGIYADSGLTSVDALRQTFRSAQSDPTISSILFHVNSFGGEVGGLADFAQEIRDARGNKPMAALADTAMYSAAYFLASQVDPGSLFLTQDAGMGSIGTIAVHADESRLNEAMGVTYTVVKAGAHKDDLSSLAPLTAESRARLQAEVDFHNQMFTAAVARARSLPVATVRGFEALTYNGKNALDVGLADAVTTFDQALARMSPPRRQSTKGANMAQKTDDPTVDAGDAGGQKPDTVVTAQPGNARVGATIHDLDEARKKFTAESKARIAEIKELCLLNAAPDAASVQAALAQATEYVSGDLTLAEIRTDLLAKKAKAQAASAGPVSSAPGFTPSAGQEHPLITASKKIRAQILDRRAKGA